MCSKHVEDSDKHIIEEIVRQIGYLSELYEDARSEKYKIFGINTFPPPLFTPKLHHSLNKSQLHFKTSSFILYQNHRQ